MYLQYKPLKLYPIYQGPQGGTESVSAPVSTTLKRSSDSIYPRLRIKDFGLYYSVDWDLLRAHWKFLHFTRVIHLHLKL